MSDEPSQIQNARKLPSGKFLALLYLPLMIPAAIPIYYAQGQSDPTLLAILIGTAIAILVGNALLLVVLYRWFSRMADS